MRFFLLLVFGGPLLFAAASPFQPDTRELLAAEARLYLSIICPGDELRDGEPGCRSCPNFVSADHYAWHLKGAIPGHFLSPSSVDVALSTDGCEPHVSNFGGTLLLTKDGLNWRVHRYFSGAITRLCRKTPDSSGRDLLLCTDTYWHQSVQASDLYALDFTREDVIRAPLVVTPNDDVVSQCHEVFASAADQESPTDEPEEVLVRRAQIKAVTFSGPKIAVLVACGTGQLGPVLKARCVSGEAFKGGTWPEPAVKMKQHTLEYVLKGDDWTLTAGSIAAKAAFEKCR
jgi:hypothetical protein